MKTLEIGIDLDGVCYDFAESLRQYLYRAELDKKYNIIDGEPDKWHFYLDWGMTLQEFIEHCNKGADLGWVFGIGEPRDAAQDAVWFIKSLGHNVNIITDRSFGQTPEVSENNTRSWLAKNEFVYDTLTFSADKTCIRNDMFIEDKLENYDALDAAGVEVYLVDRPWNQDHGDSRRRVKSIQEFATIVGNCSV